MKKIILPLIASLALLGPSVAQAHDRDHDHDHDHDDPTRRELRDITYSSIGLSRISTSFDNVKEAIALDAAMGFRLPNVQWFGVELNLGFTIIPGEVERATNSTGASCGGLLQPPCETNQTVTQDDFNAFNLGVFAVLRSPGKVFGMGKIGYRYINTSLPELDEERSGTAWGAGFGYRYNDRGGYAELQYTKISDDLDAIGFSLGYGFGSSKD